MVFARRSLRGVATAARSFRASPVTRRSGQVLGRRFYASGKGCEEHASSDLPWYDSSSSFAIDSSWIFVFAGFALASN
jgi:hypothetical protein